MNGRPTWSVVRAVSHTRARTKFFLDEVVAPLDEHLRAS